MARSCQGGRRWGGPRKLVDTSRSSTSQHSQTTSGDCKELQTGHSGILKIQFSNDLLLHRYTSQRQDPRYLLARSDVSSGSDRESLKIVIKSLSRPGLVSSLSKQVTTGHQRREKLTVARILRSGNQLQECSSLSTANTSRPKN